MDNGIVHKNIMQDITQEDIIQDDVSLIGQKYE